MNQETIDLDRALAVALEAAREAGAILLEESKGPQKISYKGDVDLVTQADVRSERLITARLRAAFPDHRIVGEELGETVEAEGASRYRWLVDPLDGTTNFAHGFPVFAVSIGLLEEDEPVVGVVYHPSADEMFSARRGGGARLNGEPIHVSQVDRLAAGLLGTGFPTHKRSETPNMRYYWEYTLRSHGVRRAGAAALDLCSVACGRFEAFWEFGLKPWDTAAGILLVREAGGLVTDFDGHPYHPGDRILLASNALIHEEMCGVAREIATMPSLTGARS
ncbi:MAG TPA: inositol monophosphatase family protein [Candidatus Dormibacteraeota bacterium]|nr:inositol monophosphatase family protein [Candidatus Dormibacteraeota bacterium]